MLIAVKEGITVFRGGTIFEVDGSREYHRPDGSIEQCLQLPDDGMGRPLLIETKDVLVCGDAELRNAEQGHSRCSFSKEEIIAASGRIYKHEFTPRSISFEKGDLGWRLIWRVPPTKNLNKECLLLNKVTMETSIVLAECLELEFEEFSISPIDYKQTVRKQKASHHAWNMDLLTPGFYVAEMDLGEGFRGRVHFIKHFDIQLSNKDPRETSDIVEVSFSEELWNAALKLKVAWGPKSRIPLQVRILERFPELAWAQANYLEKICNETLSFVWAVYEREADGQTSLSNAKSELEESYPWMDDELHAQLKVLGEYYAKLKR
jgi:hypothetical protein